MNPLALHFLPSVIRGVYRFDDELSTVTDDEDYQEFIRRKLRFLPRNIEEEIRRQIDVENESWSAPIALTKTTAASNRRAAAFFQQHSYFNNAVIDGKLATDPQLKNAQNYLEIQFVKKILAPLLTDAGLENVYPQCEVGRYRLDFALISGSRKFALETDGFGKFRERKDLDDFVRRQNFIAKEGWIVIRYSYGQVMETTDATLKELYGFLQDEPQMRGLLAIDSPPHNPFLPGFEPSETGQNVVHLVNDFHRVQDHFADLMISEMPESSPVILSDCFGLTFPFVAMAVSALFDFLTAVAEVVDIDFDLPRVIVRGVRPPRNWDVRLHPHVSVLDGVNTAAVPIDSLTVQHSAQKLPLPPSTADRVRFRPDLSVDDIEPRLQYFTKNLFGYRDGTHEFQRQVLHRVFNHKDVLGIAATGSGKSFCFWLPALLMPGLTLVIAPLRSLMRDQRLTLLNYGIASMEFINSDIDAMSQRRIVEEVKLGYVRLLYVSPERLRIRKFLGELTQLKELLPINFLAIDEAHCISEWGHDFRPSYLKIPYLINALGVGRDCVKLIALTATAGKRVKLDMLGILNPDGGAEALVVSDLADRLRFSYQVVGVNEGTTKISKYREILTSNLPEALGHGSLPALLATLNDRQEKALGIIFCIYADPHGKHSIWDGTAHYLFETMSILEPKALARRGAKKFELDAFSTGKVRVFSSKPPTLCPKCNSYAYTSKAGIAADPDELCDDDGAAKARASNQQHDRVIAGKKVCFHCKNEFDGEDSVTPRGLDHNSGHGQV